MDESDITNDEELKSKEIFKNIMLKSLNLDNQDLSAIVSITNQS